MNHLQSRQTSETTYKSNELKSQNSGMKHWSESDNRLAYIEEDNNDILSEIEVLGKVFCGIQTKAGISCINLWYNFIL